MPQGQPIDITVEARAYIVVDRQSGQVLLAKNSALSPRSLLGPRSADSGTGVTDSEVSEVPKACSTLVRGEAS